MRRTLAFALLLAPLLTCSCSQSRAPESSSSPGSASSASEAPAPAPPPASTEAPAPPATETTPGSRAPASVEPNTADHTHIEHHHLTVPEPNGASSDGQSSSAAPDIGQQENQWYQHLGSGNVHYFVAPKMIMQTGYPATATVKRPASGVADTGTNAGNALKVSDYMMVTITAPDDPDAFKIDPPPDGLCKFVPEDSTAEWDFKVTPLQPGSGKHLKFSSWVVYGNGNDACSPNNPTRQAVLSETETVSVSAIPGPANLWTRLVVYIWDNPFKSLAWALPGGLGFTLIAKLIKWLRNRKKPIPDPHPAPKSQTSSKP